VAAEAAAHERDGTQRAEHQRNEGRERGDLQRGGERRREAAGDGKARVPFERPFGRRQGEHRRRPEGDRDGDDERREQKDHGAGRDEPYGDGRALLEPRHALLPRRRASALEPTTTAIASTRSTVAVVEPSCSLRMNRNERPTRVASVW